MSSGADSCLLYAFDRLNQGLETTHVVMIGGTFSSTARPNFSDWEDDIKILADNGTKILVVNDASIKGNGHGHETFVYPGYTLGQVPISQDGSALPHHSTTCGGCQVAADNSSALIYSVYNWIYSGTWTWTP